MITIEQQKRAYSDNVRAELKKRGIANNDIDKVIAKTGFLSALDDFPEEQMHYSVSDAVNEILLVAASK